MKSSLKFQTPPTISQCKIYHTLIQTQFTSPVTSIKELEEIGNGNGVEQQVAGGPLVQGTGPVS